MIGRQELADDPRFVDNSLRVANAPELIALLRPSFRPRAVAEWVEMLLAAGVPAGPILDYAQSTTSEHAQARAMVQDIPHPVEGSIKALGFPVKLSETPQQVRYPPPLLDQHGDEIRCELRAAGRLAREIPA